MSRVYFRKSIVAKVDKTITDNTSKDSDGKLLQEFCDAVNYSSAEYKYVKEKLESKYGFEFKNYYKRYALIEQWDKLKDSLSVAKKNEKPKLKTISDNDWTKSYKDELCPMQAIQRFNELKAKERRQRLLEEVRNVELLISN